MINIDYPFDPLFPFRSPMIQTFMGWLLNYPTVTNSKTAYVNLIDNDKLAMEVTTPSKWIEYDPTVVMVHGLCGSHKSSALIRMAKKLEDRNIRAIRLNLRGCGSGKGLSRSTYHSGKSDDVIEAIRTIKQQAPHSPITLVGYSLGGNIVLKLAGDLKKEARRLVNRVIALSPPIDINASIEKFHNPKNRFYLKYFSKQLRNDIEFMKKSFSDFPDINLPKNMDMDDFNRLFVVPYFGFEDVEHYYKETSAQHVIKDINVPCKVLLSKDDPLVSWKSFIDIEIPNKMDVFVTRNGGHLGYIGNPKDINGFYWLDNQLLNWIEN